MADESAFIFQVSVKNAQGTLINIRGANGDEFATAIGLYEQYGPRFGFGGTQEAKQYVTPTTDASRPQEHHYDVSKLTVKQAPPIPAGNGNGDAKPTRQVVATVQDIKIFEGRSPKGAWTKTTLVTTEGEFGCFDKKLSAVLPRLKGCTVQLTLAKNDKGYENITGFEDVSLV